MEKFVKICYIAKIILFFLHFYFLFASLYCIMAIKYLGIVFILLYIIFVIKILLEMLSKKKQYKEDFAYNIMQCGFLFYIMTIAFRINYSKIYVTNNTLTYFYVNYGILSILVLFILAYGMIEFKNVK